MKVIIARKQSDGYDCFRAVRRVASQPTDRHIEINALFYSVKHADNKRALIRRLINDLMSGDEFLPTNRS